MPRIDKNLIEQYHSDIIVLSGNAYGEIPNLLLNVGEKQAEEALLWWKDLFKDDFYIEINRHNTEVESLLNQQLVDLANKHQVKIVATNNTFYIEQKATGMILAKITPSLKTLYLLSLLHIKQVIFARLS